MDLKVFWFGELVADGGSHSLNEIANRAQAADHSLYLDTLPSGVCLGLSVAQQVSPNMTVALAQGVAYDTSGQRIYVPSTQTVNLAVDSSSVSTTVTGPTHSRIVSVLVKFERNNQTPFTDLNNVGGFEDQYESFSIHVVQGTEAVSPVAPAIPAGMVLLADVTIAYAQTAVHTGDIDLSTRRAFAWRIVGTTYTSPHTITQGTGAAAMADMLGWFNGHVSGSADKHAATGITYAGSGSTHWADVTALASGSVDSALTAIVAAMAGTTGGSSGADKVGAPAVSASPLSLAAGSIASQLSSLTSQVATDLNAKAPIASPTFTGTVTVPTGVTLTTAQNWYRRPHWTAYSNPANQLVFQNSGVYGGVSAPIANVAPAWVSASLTSSIIYAWLRFGTLPQGAVATSLSVKTRGAGSTGGLNLPTYQMAIWNSSTGTFTPLSGVVADVHTSGNWTSTNQTTPIALTGGQFTVDNALGDYILVINLPSSGSGASFELYDVELSGTAGVIEPT